MINKIRVKVHNMLKTYNYLYFILGPLIIIGFILTIMSNRFGKNMENIILSIGTGIMTSSLVSLFIEISNVNTVKMSNKIYFNDIIETIIGSAKLPYVEIIYKINDYNLKYNV